MLNTALFGVVPPALATGLAVIALWQPWRKEPPKVQTLALAGTALAIGVGYIAADLLVNGFKGLLPVASLDYRPHAAALGTLAGIVALTAKRGIAAAAFAIAIAAVVLWMRRRVLFAPSPPNPEIIFAAAAISAGALLALILSRASSRERSHTVLAPVAIALGALAIAQLQSGSASLAQMAGSLALTLAPLGLLALLRPRWPIARAAVGPVVLTSLALIIAWRISKPDINPLSQLTVVAALAAPGITLLIPAARPVPWARTLIACIVALAASIAAIALTPSGFNFAGL